MRLRQSQHGMLLIAAIFLVVVVAVLLTSLSHLNTVGLGSSASHMEANKAYYIAQSGLERAVLALTDPELANRLDCVSGVAPAVESLTDVSVGAAGATAGAFTITVTGAAASYSSTPALLSAGIAAGEVRIPASSVAGYADLGGRIMVDRELIDYSVTSTSAAACSPVAQPCFVVTKRGAAGTVAAPHAIATRIGQYQCNLQSAGGVPDLGSTTVRAKRFLRQGVQLFEAWAGGAAGAVGQQPWFVRYQDVAASPWTELNNAGFNIGVTSDIKAMSMLSYADGFAVGGNAGGEVIYRWQSSPSPGWLRMGPFAAIPDVDLNSVHCLAGNYCWVVGANSGGLLVISWDGASWARNATATAIASVTLNSVYCNSSSDCWAVGANSGGLLTIQWNGANWVRNATATSLASVDLNSVFCSSSANCWAVGNNSGGLLVLHWTGATWARNASATGIAMADLKSVSCSSSTDCWAVGVNTGGLLAIHWNGTSWARDGTATSIAATDLNAVTCAHPRECWAVGNNSGGELIIKWNGSAWSRHLVSASVSDRNLFAVQVLGASQRPDTGRQEVFP